jgi:hypothetical protein
MNKITYEEPPVTTLGNLTIGDMFLHDNIQYMRIPTLYYHNVINFNVINLTNGQCALFGVDVPVKRINRLTIERIS